MGKFFGFLAFLVVLAAAAAGGGYFYIQNAWGSPGPATADGASRIVVIPKGSGTPAIADKLVESGAITNELFFKLAVRWEQAGPKLKAGEYEVASGASINAIVDQLVKGDVILHQVTVPEGLTSATIMKIVADAPVLSGEMPQVTPAEGVLLPETYKVERGDTREALIARMIADRKKLMDELWAKRQPGLPFETQEQAIILASIVEKEASIATERPQVAAVFINRLRRGIRMETDPTIIYGVCKLHPDRCKDGKLVDKNGNRRVILQSELDMDTGYNTYRIDGLPPTPISNPGKESIAAVLNPPVSDALFFVADGTGGHVFAATYAEHQANVAKWRKIEKAALAAETPDNPVPPPAAAKTPPAKPPAAAPTTPAPAKPPG